MKKHLLLYLAVITMPLLLALVVWQSTRYMDLEREIARLEAAQEEWVEGNKRLIAGIAMLSSSERIENIARNDPSLVRVRPEDILQIRIEEGQRGN
ncbi:MAG: septum formation initiator family protein [Treponema sp.]|jgi:cell division protein FtsL|nr:septum formation initiator family protein [Treponema sp.]